MLFERMQFQLFHIQAHTFSSIHQCSFSNASNISVPLTLRTVLFSQVSMIMVFSEWSPSTFRSNLLKSLTTLYCIISITSVICRHGILYLCYYPAGLCCSIESVLPRDTLIRILRFTEIVWIQEVSMISCMQYPMVRWRWIHSESCVEFRNILFILLPVSFEFSTQFSSMIAS